MTVPLTPIFRSSYSIGGSLLTLEEPGKAKPGNALSVFDIAKEADLKEVIVVDDRPDGAIQGLKVATKLGIKLIYGIRFTVCANMADKAIESRRTESRVIVMVKGGPINEMGVPQGYTDLLKLWSRAWGPMGHIRYMLAGDEYAYGRLDWNLLREMWTENLVLALPYTGSFIGRNTTTFSQITPSLPPNIPIWVFREVESQLLAAPLIDRAIERYAFQDARAVVMPTKTVCYVKRADMKAYVTLRCLNEGTVWEEGVRGLVSDNWCWEAYKELAR